MNFSRKKENFINNVLLVYDDFSSEIVDAFVRNDYEDFLPDIYKEKAYLSEKIKISDGRYTQNLLIIAKLLKLASVKKDDFILNIGAGYGYVTALLASLSGAVVATEHDNALFERFEKTIVEKQIDNIALFKSQKGKGFVSSDPYDLIFINDVVTGALDSDLFSMLSKNGRIIGIEKNKSLFSAFIVMQGSNDNRKKYVFNFI